MHKHQEAETLKVEFKLKLSLEETEKLKSGLATERATWQNEKPILLQRAEAAEASLKSTAEELTGLKRQIDAMTSTVFGKEPLHKLLTYNIHKTSGLLIIVYDAGSRIAHLRSDMRNKLKAAYTLIEQLYTGAQRIICSTSHNKLPPTLIRKL